MPIFQRNVVAKYLKSQSEDISERYKAYKTYFLNPEVQENIRTSKEEQFQEGFLRKLFAEILGYTVYPDPNFNLKTEFKNSTDSKKADGAILINDEPVGVIELKDHKTKDLRTVEAQAFGYKNNHKTTRYVIISNFEKLRFYIDHAEEFEEFDLFNLSEEDFKRLYLILGYVNVEKGLPLTIKSESKSEEKGITENLYKDYSAFKRDLFNDILSKNDGVADKLTLFRKTQKLLDRLLFIFFAEDRGLFPPNVILRIIDETEALQEMGEEKSLYDHYKTYFKWLDEGRKSKSLEIFAYNGGLFKKDELLDSLKIDDKLLETHTRKLSAYDFESDVSVDILGHIFEHSLSEIEEIQNELNGVVTDKKASKRKKDGVFYTPAYITKYIVENTVGTLCNNKKQEMGINLNEGEELRLAEKALRADVLKKHVEKLDAYREWLLGLTIVDPACGSGAFLNAAVQFLKEEHKAIDEAKASLFEKNDAIQLALSDIETEILEKNIFGVDINDESVEIAKLSLWLHTAKPGRKLNNLNNNIKCGNSLISDPEIAGEKAFDWEKEFPEVFAKGGFDVVVGNPPYVRQELIQSYIPILKEYKVHSGKSDLYTYFYEKGCEILKDNGVLSFISSGKFFEADYGKKLVEFLFDNLNFTEVVNFDDLEVFEGISAYPLIFTAFKRKLEKDYCFRYCYVPEQFESDLSQCVSSLKFKEIWRDDFKKNEYKFYDRQTSLLFEHLKKSPLSLAKLNCLPLVGVKTGYNEGFLMSDFESPFVKPYLFGRNIKKYSLIPSDDYVFFPYKIKDEEYILCNESTPEIAMIEGRRAKLEQRAIICDGIINGSKKWYEYQQINKKLSFDSEYIVYPNVSLGNNFTLSKGRVIDMTGFIIPSNNKTLLAILNSKVVAFIMRKIAITRRGGYQEYKVQYLQQIPLPEIEDVIFFL